MIPAVSVAQMREVDRLMVEQVGIDLFQMMENAGRALAEHTRQLLGGDVQGRRVLVLAGRGGNGGGGLTAARRLALWNAEVTVLLGQGKHEIGGVPARQLAIVERIGLPIFEPASSPPAFAQADVLIDALIGYSLSGPPREPIAGLIRKANASGVPIVALDIPSGLHGDSGDAFDPTIRATTTLTLALPKAGLLQPAARAWVGSLYLADISVPEAVYRQLGLNVGPIFSRSDIVPIGSGAG